MHALCTLQVLGRLDEEELLAGLHDVEPGVREQSARLAEGLAGDRPAIAAALMDLAGDANPMVRLQAAFSLGAVSDRRALEALATIALRDPASRWVRAAVESALRGRTGAFLDVVAARGFLDKPEGRVWLDELAALVGAENQPAEIQALVDRFAGPEADSARVRAVILGLGRGLQRSGGSLRRLLEGPTAGRFAPIFDRAAAAAGSDGPVRDRIEAIRLLGLGPVERALDVLIPLLDARQPGEVQLAALQTLNPLPDRRIAGGVLGQWRALSPAVRREAIELLFTRPERLPVLLDALDGGRTVLPIDLDPARRGQLLGLDDQKLRARAVRLLGAVAGSDRNQVISGYRRALELSGQPERGRNVFQKTCATCHRAENAGVDVGPNLATITNRTAEDLLVHILDPNREVAPPYLNYNVALADGRVLSGIIADESANALVLKRAEGASDVVPRSQIETVSSTGQSLMPEGLEKGLEAQDFADLIAYLRGIQASGPAPVQR
jgi:putative heme-binding domain-containing protein